MSNYFDPTTGIGTIVLTIISGVILTGVMGGIAWLTGPLRWWKQGKDLRQILLNGRSFVFVFNQTPEQSKTITFLPNGDIGEGRNSNEYTWRIHHGKLELLAHDGLVYSRFVQDKKRGKLIHTNDPDTRSIHGQYMQSHYKPWQITTEDNTTAESNKH
ncbi:MAG: hypothetical protein JBO36_15465 [Candidatus Thiodiazotropha taylori]|nr:hypothetical protein [Candidatus Thiodiazotropha taylori]